MRAWLSLLCWTSLAPCAAVPGSEEQAGKHHVAVSHIKSKGHVTATELRAHLAAEHREHFEHERAKMLAAIDTLQHDMPRYDRDKDGFLDANEAKFAVRNMPSPMTVIEQGIGPGMMMYSNDANFAAADTNGDQKLSMEEMTAHHKEKIDEDMMIGWAAMDLMRVADKDEDEKLTGEEAEKVLTAFKRHLHHGADDL